MPVSPTPQRQRQEDRCKLKASLVNMLVPDQPQVHPEILSHCATKIKEKKAFKISLYAEKKKSTYLILQHVYLNSHPESISLQLKRTHVCLFATL